MISIHLIQLQWTCKFSSPSRKLQHLISFMKRPCTSQGLLEVPALQCCSPTSHHVVKVSHHGIHGEPGWQAVSALCIRHVQRLSGNVDQSAALLCLYIAVLVDLWITCSTAELHLIKGDIYKRRWTSEQGLGGGGEGVLCLWAQQKKIFLPTARGMISILPAAWHTDTCKQLWATVMQWIAPS